MKPGLSTLHELLTTPDSPALGPGPRSGVQPAEVLHERIERCLRESSLPSQSRDLIRALILLWHDHLDLAHSLSQSVETSDGSYVHALMHRREPDYGNAKYWFRRVGVHPCFSELSSQAGKLLQHGNENALAVKLRPGGRWDPLAFVDACESVQAAPASNTKVQTLQAIQVAEFEVLLRYLNQE